jgi:hypothetical protein
MPLSTYDGRNWVGFPPTLRTAMIGPAMAPRPALSNVVHLPGRAAQLAARYPPARRFAHRQDRPPKRASLLLSPNLSAFPLASRTQANRGQLFPSRHAPLGGYRVANLVRGGCCSSPWTVEKSGVTLQRPVYSCDRQRSTDSIFLKDSMVNNVSNKPK